MVILVKISVNGVYVRALTCRPVDTRNYVHQGYEIQFSGITNKKRYMEVGQITDYFVFSVTSYI